MDTYLLPAAMRELPPPWHDLTYRRSQALEALAPTEERREQARHVLRACLPARRQSVHDWDEELRDFYDDRDDHTLDEADAWLTRTMPTTSQVTRERVARVVGAWADMGIPTVPEPPTEQWVDEVAAEWAASVRQALAYDAFSFIERATTAGLRNDGEAEDVALLAAAFVRVGVAVEAAVRVLVSLGRPRGEQALRELVNDDEVRDLRPYVRSRLLGLRRPVYEARAREVTRDEEPLLPQGLRGLPYSWQNDFDWGTTEPDSHGLAQARSALEACLTVERVPDDGQMCTDTPADRSAVAEVVRALMPYPRLVTRERMNEAWRECQSLGFEFRGMDAACFADVWCMRIADRVTAAVFRWLADLPQGGGVADDKEPAVLSATALWAAGLAERCARCGSAVQEAIWFLHRTDDVPSSREALARLAFDPSLPATTRNTAQEWAP
ncbi:MULTISPECIES: hypothetical protein [Streptomyces]|uniref:Uncharacterized protein n=1 Tax=Streptomyces koelreuteriae TaxID=2838015 RepID=A0ABX8FQB0_9ACTN|nr:MULTISPECIES: hypothetical protein [Streptomyces]QWB23333.1 hypothetical protein KJK29_12360 [Streptomyces koelreuteriae]UUA06285.1 hypothetical protein NNW98_12415 [Streptomyces koelreuteriae]UUA13912.1 hypothetical protein NNW99_12415 [Streptomyces sp. CRCS-T-1]